MSKKTIIIITSTHLHTFVENMINEIQPDYQIQIMEYYNFSHMAEIFKKVEREADGFMVSGSAALSFLKKMFPDSTKPIVSFHADLLSVYHTLFDILLENRNLDMKRVIFDFLLPVQEDASVDFFLHTDMESIAPEMDDWLKDTTTQDFSMLETNMASKAIRLWESQKIDLVLCNYSSIIPILEARNIPCHYIYPTKHSFLSLFDTLTSQLEYDEIMDNLPAVIAISDLNPQKTTATQEHLRNAILDWKKEFVIDAIIQEEKERFYIFTTSKIASMLSQNYNQTSIYDALVNRYHIPIALGCGIGQNITDAKANADTALKESFFAGDCFIMDEKKQLHGPLKTKQCLHVETKLTDDICQVADKCKLSTLTIQKLVAIMKMTGSDKFTSQSLAEHLDISVRNANRILGNLEKGGAATMAFTRSSTTKGRPTKVYQLHFKGEA